MVVLVVRALLAEDDDVDDEWAPPPLPLGLAFLLLA